MPSLNIEQLADLVELTQRDYIKTDYISLITDLQDHPFAKALMKQSRIDGTQGQAEGLYFKARMRTAGSYRHILPTTPDQVTITNDYVGGSVPWRKVEVKYGFLEEETDFNMTPNQIVALVKERERGMDVDFVEGFERDGWTAPAVADTNAFYSVPYWFPKNATVGFNGTALSGFTNPGSISAVTWPRWASYTGNYTNVSLDALGLISLARDMADLTSFKPPVPGIPDLGMVNGPPKAFYTNLAVRKTFADVADSRNDNLGPDVAAMDGKVTFRSAEVMWVPVLDADTTNPFYQIPWDVFKWFIKKGWFQKRTMLKPYPGQRNQIATFKDTYSNFVCFNRRAGGVLATGTSYPA